MIACTLLRLYPNVLLGSIIKDFARLRPPGIYKDAYLEELFKYHHELRSAAGISIPGMILFAHVYGRRSG